MSKSDLSPETLNGRDHHGEKYTPNTIESANQVHESRVSDRIVRIAQNVLPGARVVDVGTDHALLPIFLIERNLASAVIASDLREGPLASAKRNVMDAGLANRIAIRLGPGLTTVRPGEVDTVVIAGMGGKTIVEVLGESPDVVHSLNRLILQPMGAARLVREYLVLHSFSIKHEEVFIHQNKFYELIVAEPHSSVPSKFEPTAEEYADYSRPLERELALEFGPTLLNTPTETFRLFLIDTKTRWQVSLASLKQGQSQSARERRKQLEQRIAWVDAWLGRHAEP